MSSLIELCGDKHSASWIQEDSSFIKLRTPIHLLHYDTGWVYNSSSLDNNLTVSKIPIIEKEKEKKKTESSIKATNKFQYSSFSSNQTASRGT